MDVDRGPARRRCGADDLLAVAATRHRADGAGGAGGAGGQGGGNANGTNASQGNPGLPGAEGATGTDGHWGNGGTAGIGGTGGIGGAAGIAGANSGAGGSAYATAFTFDQSKVYLNTTAIKATATAGKGVGRFESSDAYVAAGGTDNADNTGSAGTAGATTTTQNGATNLTSNGGAGGTGITPTGTVAQSNNGAEAIAMGLETAGGELGIASGAGLEISAEAKDASETNTATAVKADGSKNVYAITGDMTVKAAATGDVDLTTAAAGTNPEFVYKANETKTTAAAATAFDVNGGTMDVVVDGKLTVEAFSDKGETSNTSTAIKVDNTVVNVHTSGAIDIKAGNGTKAAYTGIGKREAYGIKGDNNTLSFISDAGGISVSAIGKNSDYAVQTAGSTVTFDATEDGIVFIGDVEVKTSTLNLKSNTQINGNGKGSGEDSGNSAGMLNIQGTTMNLTDNLSTLTVADTTTLDSSTVYFYDKNNNDDQYNNKLNADGKYYDTGAYRTIDTEKLEVNNDTDLYMRTNIAKAYVNPDDVTNYDYKNSDKIISKQAGTGTGTLNITVFDQGMRNGYMNVADAAGSGNHLYLNADDKTVDAGMDKVILVENAGTVQVNPNTTTSYDNGFWDYDYEVETKNDGTNIVIDSIKTTKAVQSSAQKAAQDANKIAAGAAVTLFGADETLMERLGDVRNSADDNDGVWAKYVGGKIKVDGIDGDNDFKYNGFAAGYDREVGNNWRIGLAGQYAKGDTTLTGGDGEIKTAAGALYGTWTGDKGHHVDIIAKVGKVDSETSAYGGTIAQKLDGDFGSTAMSFAVEYGYRQQLNDGWFIEPMARASYVHLGSDDYTVSSRDGSMSVTNDAMNSIVLRGGFLLGKTFAENSNVYLKAAVLHDFDGDINTSVTADGRSAKYSDSIGGTAIEYGIGVNHKFNKDSSMYLDVERVSGGDVTKNWGVNVGFRYSF